MSASYNCMTYWEIICESYSMIDCRIYNLRIYVTVIFTFKGISLARITQVIYVAHTVAHLPVPPVS